MDNHLLKPNFLCFHAYSGNKFIPIEREIAQMVVYSLEEPLLSHGVKDPRLRDTAHSDIS